MALAQKKKRKKEYDMKKKSQSLGDLLISVKSTFCFRFFNLQLKSYTAHTQISKSIPINTSKKFSIYHLKN